MLIIVALIVVYFLTYDTQLSKHTFSKEIADKVYREQYANALDAFVRFNIDTSVILAIICVESQGDSNAVGSSTERGLMQLKQAALTDANSVSNLNYSFDEMFQARKNVLSGSAYLRWLLNRLFTIQLAVRAYNAGIGNIRQNPSLGQSYLDSVTRYANYIHSISV
jgi:soluble lytic murein transglycosylase